MRTDASSLFLRNILSVGMYARQYRSFRKNVLCTGSSNVFIMPNTYTQIHLQFVFAVKYRAALIDNGWKDELEKYITGIIQYNKHKMLQINAMPDHIHLFIGMRPGQSISALIQNVKTESNIFIKTKKLTRSPFAWQEGFGAFSYSKSHLPNVIQYVMNQQEHHRKETFLDEYKRLLTVFDIDWNERYIFKEPA
jgi:putative transposase